MGLLQKYKKYSKYSDKEYLKLRNLKVKKPAKAQIFINSKTAKIMGFETPEEILGIKTDIVGLK